MEENDNVNSPRHYTAGGIECIDAIQAALTPEEFRGYCKGNALKYIWRERMKGGDESVKKAEWYMNRMLSVPVEKVNPTDHDIKVALHVRDVMTRELIAMGYGGAIKANLLSLDIFAILSDLDIDK